MNTGLRKSVHFVGFALLALAVVVAIDRAPVRFDSRSFYKHGPIVMRRNPDGTIGRDVLGARISYNWSGYVVASYATNGFYGSAKMEWVVPAVTYGSTLDTTRSPQYSSNWVGIGGFCQDYLCTSTDYTLIQLGTEQDVSSDGTTHYYAWYETLPLPETPLNVNRHPVMPGDAMKASLTCVADCDQPVQTWRLRMKDKTQGWTWQRKIPYGSSVQSAEWIEEAPFSGGILPLANFGTSRFSAKIGTNGVTPSLTYYGNGLQLGNSWGQTSNPSTPNASAGFNACWGFVAYIPCPAP
jgi:Peptidase A4 family